MADFRSNDRSSLRRRGAVAVIVRDGRFLVIERSAHVAAPGKFCFPGGGIEGSESEAEALVRELGEELGVAVTPLRRVWRSVTRWQVELFWWAATLDEAIELSPNPLEVASVHWLTVEELLAHSELLESNRAFFAALAAGNIVLD